MGPVMYSKEKESQITYYIMVILFRSKLGTKLSKFENFFVIYIHMMNESKSVDNS